jgi:hypothetical protein
MDRIAGYHTAEDTAAALKTSNLDTYFVFPFRSLQSIYFMITASLLFILWRYQLPRVRYNELINTLLKGEHVLRFIKSQRIRRLGHIERMEDNAMPKRMLKGRLYSKRRKGRPRMAAP